MAKKSIPRLPQLLDRKIYKTGQTRGADDDVIFQNRVSRNSTVLIPYQLWGAAAKPPAGEEKFDSGFLCLISPEDYFGNAKIDSELASKGLRLGENIVVFYETRAQWRDHNPEQLKWTPAESRVAPLQGQYVARVPATTAAQDGGRTVRGFTSSSNKGAGIRIYEYASLPMRSASRIRSWLPR